MNRLRFLAIFVGSSVGLTGCSPGQSPFRIVQICLTDAKEIPAFTSMMNEIAQTNEMIFTDRSGQAEAELRSIGTPNVSVPNPLLNIGANRSGEFSFGAGNLGLPTEQIAIGFNGKDNEAAREFADHVVAKLATRWVVHEVPKGRGALPIENCD